MASLKGQHGVHAQRGDVAQQSLKGAGQLLKQGGCSAAPAGLPPSHLQRPAPAGVGRKLQRQESCTQKKGHTRGEDSRQPAVWPSSHGARPAVLATPVKARARISAAQALLSTTHPAPSSVLGNEQWHSMPTSSTPQRICFHSTSAFHAKVYAFLNAHLAPSAAPSSGRGGRPEWWQQPPASGRRGNCVTHRIIILTLRWTCIACRAGDRGHASAPLARCKRSANRTWEVTSPTSCADLPAPMMTTRLP